MADRTDSYHPKKGTMPLTLPDWFDLQRDFLELILDRLPFVDVLHPRGICRSWQSIAKPISHFHHYSTVKCFELHGCFPVQVIKVAMTTNILMMTKKTTITCMVAAFSILERTGIQSEGDAGRWVGLELQVFLDHPRVAGALGPERKSHMCSILSWMLAFIFFHCH